MPAEEKPPKFNLQHRYREVALKHSIGLQGVNNYFMPCFNSSYHVTNFRFFSNLFLRLRTLKLPLESQGGNQPSKQQLPSSPSFPSVKYKTKSGPDSDLQVCYLISSLYPPTIFPL